MPTVVTAARIRDDLRNNLGIREGDCLAVHSSMKSLGQVDGGARALIDALVEAIGGPDRGTLLMPCFTQPLDVVDARHTPCRLGLVPETFRTYPGVVLSNCHTHRVAVLGRDAAELAALHDHTTPLGRGSPFHELARRGGHVLHIGCDLTSCSLIHVAEHMFPLPFHAAQIAYPSYDKVITLVCTDGSRRLCPPRENPGDSHAFGVVQEAMDRYGLIHHGRVGEAACLKLRGLDILAVAMDLLAGDPAALLCRNPNCSVCARKRQIAETANLV
jgi:aminoglycoside 3-N-acetyltransferase